MKRKIYLTVIWVITLAAMLIGLFCHTSFFPAIFGIDRSAHRGTASGYVNQTETDEFHSIDARLDAAVITVEEGSQFGISCTGTEKLQPEVSCSDGVLSLKQSGVSVFNIGSDTPEVTITVPAGTKLQDVRITADAGNVILTGCTIHALDISTDAGNVEITDLQCDSISLKMDMGNLSADACTFTDLSAKMDLGKAEINAGQNLDNAEISLSADLGNIYVNGQEMNHGYQQSGTSGQTINISADMGNISLTW